MLVTKAESVMNALSKNSDLSSSSSITGFCSISINPRKASIVSILCEIPKPYWLPLFILLSFATPQPTVNTPPHCQYSHPIVTLHKILSTFSFVAHFIYSLFHLSVIYDFISSLGQLSLLLLPHICFSWSLNFFFFFILLIVMPGFYQILILLLLLFLGLHGFKEKMLSLLKK